MLGHDVDAWLGPHGLTLAALGDCDRRLPHAEVNDLLVEAVALSGDPALGVRAVRWEEPGDLGVVEHAAATCATVGDAIRVAIRFIGLVHDGIRLDLHVAAPLAVLRARVPSGLACVPAAIDLLFASLVHCGSQLLGRPVRPLRVELAHPGPADATTYVACFREVRFDAGEHAMFMRSAALDVPMPAANPSLLQILTRYADHLLRELAPPRARAFSERARVTIADELPSGSPTAERIAHRLAVSVRTLHRRLAADGTSHHELVDDVRRTRAMLHLAGVGLSIGEISLRLGFAHPSAFHRAFKRWTRMTPAEYRFSAARAPGRAALLTDVRSPVPR
jgi:AraC-like DNA-binding protein